MVVLRFNPEIIKLLNCSFSLKKNILAACSSNGKLIIFDTNLNQKIPRIFQLHKTEILRSFFSNKAFVTASLDRTCSLWNIDKMEKIRMLRMFSSGGIDIDMLDDMILTLEISGNLILWDRRIAQPLNLFHSGIPTQNCRFFGNFEKILTCSAFSEFYLWDLRYKRKPLSIFSIAKSKTEVSSFSISKSFFFCLCKNGQVSRFSLNFDKFSLGYKKIKISCFKTVNKSCNFVSISTDFLGEFFAYGNSRGESLIRSQKTCKLLKKFNVHDGNVNCVAFNNNNRLIATCGDDGSLIINHMKKKNV